MSHSFSVRRQLELLILFVQVQLSFGTTPFPFGFSRTLCSLVQHNKEPIEQAMHSRRQVWCGVSLRWCNRGYHFTLTGIWPVWSWARRGMRNFWRERELRVSNLALLARGAVDMYYSMARHLWLSVFSRFVLYCRDICMKFNRRSEGSVRYLVVSVTEVFWSLKLTTCITSEGAAHCAIVTRFQRQTSRAEKFLTRTQNGCYGENSIIPRARSVQRRFFSIALAQW